MTIETHGPGTDPNDERPEADVSEQAELADPSEVTGPEGPPHDPEAPEADALEQRAPVRAVGDEAAVSTTTEASEADVLDQARDAGPDEDDDR